jgi:hypothetical protein
MTDKRVRSLLLKNSALGRKGASAENAPPIDAAPALAVRVRDQQPRGGDNSS